MVRKQACQYIQCSKEFETSKHLKMCSRCKRARYCSENCQREDWKQHKDTCRLQAAANHQSEELSKLGMRTREGLDPLKLSLDLKKWSARHKDWQTVVKSQALKIWRSDSQWRSLGVLVGLNVHDVAPDSKDTPYIFTFNSVTALPFPMITEMARRQGSEFETLILSIKEQEGYLKTGVGGRKVARYMIMVIAAANAWIVAPEVVLETELENVPKEDSMWLERARQSLQFPFNMDIGKAINQIRNEWALKQEKALTFIAINCLKLKENPTRGRTHLVEIDTVITNSPKRGYYNITSLDAEEKTFAAYYAQCDKQGLTAAEYKEELEDAEKRCQKPETYKGFPGNRVMISMMIGFVSTLVPVFVADITAATLETRVDWQEHKYRLLVKRINVFGHSYSSPGSVYLFAALLSGAGYDLYVKSNVIWNECRHKSEFVTVNSVEESTPSQKNKQDQNGLEALHVNKSAEENDAGESQNILGEQCWDLTRRMLARNTVLSEVWCL